MLILPPRSLPYYPYPPLDLIPRTFSLPIGLDLGPTGQLLRHSERPPSDSPVPHSIALCSLLSCRVRGLSSSSLWQGPSNSATPHILHIPSPSPVPHSPPSSPLSFPPPQISLSSHGCGLAYDPMITCPWLSFQPPPCLATTHHTLVTSIHQYPVIPTVPDHDYSWSRAAAPLTLPGGSPKLSRVRIPLSRPSLPPPPNPQNLHV